jgi:hypothetical protein
MTQSLRFSGDGSTIESAKTVGSNHPRLAVPFHRAFYELYR